MMTYRRAVPWGSAYIFKIAKGIGSDIFPTWEMNSAESPLPALGKASGGV
jgi:hypothetical protein